MFGRKQILANIEMLQSRLTKIGIEANISNNALDDKLDIKFTEISEDVHVLQVHVNNIDNIIKKLDLKNIELILSSVNSKLEVYEKNLAKLDEMVRELKGCVAMSRASLKEKQEEKKASSKKK